MKINDEVILIGQEMDSAFDNRDTGLLIELSNKSVEMSKLNECSLLDKMILSYHSATGFANYLSLQYNGKITYSNSNQSESEYEYAIYLYRIAMEYCNSYESENIESDPLEREFFKDIKNRIYTNFSNDMYLCGRLLKSIAFLKEAHDSVFPMATGNLALKLMKYAEFDYDEGHRLVHFNEAYGLLLSIMDKEMHIDAHKCFTYYMEVLEANFSEEFLESPYIFKDYSLGNTIDEQSYRKWCLKNKLFLNTLNDYFNNSQVANDCIHLPTIITEINIGVKYHGLFNQIKQEYVSSRFMIYEGLTDKGHHFSDREVFMYNTLDYPVYGLNIEKIKCAYRCLYSLFDKISFFINDYYDIGIKDTDVSLKSIWQSEKKGRDAYKYNLYLKEYMSNEDTYNVPLIGLYWLYKDISKKKIKHDYLDPKISDLSEIRNALEHRYLKIHDYDFNFGSSNNLYDKLSKSVSMLEFEKAAMRLLEYSREAIILLVLIVQQEEFFRKKNRDSDGKIGIMKLTEYEDEWKQIF